MRLHQRGGVPMTHRMLLALGVVLAVLVTAALAQAATFTTNDPGSAADANPGNGTCATAGAVCTLQAAVDEVNARNAGDTIRHEVTTVDGDGVTVTVNNITIDGTQAAGFVACTGHNCSAANWVGKVDLDGGTAIAIAFADGTTGAVVYVAQWPHTAVQVVVESGSCSALSLVLEGRIAGSTWAPIGSAITHSDVPVTESRAWAIPAGFHYIRARAATVTSCTVSVYGARNG